MVDDDTLQFYRCNAEAYAGWAKAPSTRLKGFLALLPPGGSILELGCGAGNHSAEMVAAGFSVRATDGSPEMAELASRRLGRAVDFCIIPIHREQISNLKRIRIVLRRTCSADKAWDKSIITPAIPRRDNKQRDIWQDH